MKKILIIILSILLFCAFIAGCNKNESSTDLGASSTISENSFESSFVDSFEDSSIDSSENTSEDSSKNTSEDSSIDSSNDSSISEDITVEYELELLTNLYNIKVEECIILDLLFKANGENADWSLLTFTSSNPSVATVDKEGLITGINQGNATITIEMEGKLLTATVTVTSIQEITAEQVNTFDEEYVNIFGRSYITNNKLNLDHGASAVELGIFGTSLKINLKTSANSYMRVWVDGVEEPDRIKIIPSVTNYTIVNNLENTYHQIRIIKATEMNEATWEILSFEAEKFMTVPEKPALKLEFVGDSISAGYGSLGKNGDRYSVDNSDSTRTYAILTANKLNADYSVVACSGICAKAYHWQKSINMNTLYTYTSYKNQSNYQFDFQPDVIVLNLGTNEGSYLSPSYGGSSYAQLFPADYKEMLTTIRSNNPSAYIICLYGMMGVNSTINSGILNAISQMADDKIVYNPFVITPNMEAVGGHPGITAQERWASQLAEYIQSLNIKPCVHVYDDNCDEDCNLCGKIRIAKHVYDDNCDEHCNQCSHTRNVTHVYDNACDAICNECNNVRDVAEHVYDNACDTICNECGSIRDVAEHVYDNACDTICNECGNIRDVADHVYDDDNDLDCNVCGAEKAIDIATCYEIDLDMVYNNGLILSSDSVVLDITEISGIESVIAITFNNEELKGANYVNGKITVPKSSFGKAFGEGKIVIQAVKNGNLTQVNLPILLITQVITTAEELDAMYSIADALDVSAQGKSYPFISDGYFMLGCDIKYEKSYTAWPAWNDPTGKWRNAVQHGFKGTFDGKGYCIDGMEISNNYNAFMTLLHADGIIKNVGFTNAKLSGIASAIVCCWGGGTVENVYVEYAQGVFGAAGGYNGTFFATDNLHGITQNCGLKVIDCYIDATKITGFAQANKARILGYNSADTSVSYVTMHGVYALVPTGCMSNGILDAEDKATELFFWFESATDMLSHSKTQREIASWSTDYWTIVDGVPVWREIQ